MNYLQDEIRERLELGRKPKDNTLTKKRTNRKTKSNGDSKG